MQNVRLWRLGQAAVAAALLLALPAGPAAALDLFARHEVTVRFATPEGKPLAGAEVRVFAPGQTGQPTLTGRTDKDGRFEFPAGRDGFWSAEARAGGEIARVVVRVGGASENKAKPLSPYWVLGGLFLLLVLAFAFRILRIRARRRNEPDR